MALEQGHGSRANRGSNAAYSLTNDETHASASQQHEASLTPSTNQSLVQEQPADSFHLSQPNDLTGNPIKTDMVLHPNGLWFHDPSVVRKVTKSWKKSYNGPYTCWSQAPEAIRAKWWTSFRAEYSWDPTVANDIRSEWEAKTKSRLRDTISKLAKNDRKKASWCASSTREALKKKREDLKFLEKSRKCSNAKLVGPNAGSVHCQGSIATEYLKKKMTEELGRPPSLAEVFRRGHEVKGIEDTFIDPKSNRVWNKFVGMQASASQQENHATDDEMFLEASGGFDKKRRLYGVGSLAKSYYKPPSSNGNCSKKPRSERELELEEQVTELVAANKAQEKKNDHLQAQLDELSRYIKGRSDDLQ